MCPVGWKLILIKYPYTEQMLVDWHTTPEAS